MVRNSHPYHPECTSAAWTPATFLRHPATGHGAGRRTGSTPTARHVGPRSTTPGQPAPSFAGTSRRQDPATLMTGVTGWTWSQHRLVPGIPLLWAAIARLVRMARSSYVTSSGYRSSVASRSHRWAGVEYAASSRSSSARRLRSVAELAGIRRVHTRNQSPGRVISSPHTPPCSITPTTVSTVPASSGRQRCRAPRARRIRPMTVISAPV